MKVAPIKRVYPKEGWLTMFRKADRQDLQNIPAMLSAVRIRLETLGDHDKLLLGCAGVLENRMKAIEQNQTKDREAISSWISGIEQGQDKLLQSHAALERKNDEQYRKLMLLIGILSDATTKRLDTQIDILGGMAAPKPKPRRKR